MTEDRLQKLQDDIDDVRRQVEMPADQDEPAFVDDGEASEDQPVDDTIAPPG